MHVGEGILQSEFNAACTTAIFNQNDTLPP